MYENKINNMLYKLSKSKFRSSFHLRKYMIEYIDEKGIDKIKEHTISFITEKLADSNPKNDGKQTPTKKSSNLYCYACMRLLL